MIQVKVFYAHNDLRNFSYLIWDKSSGHSWVIDPFDEKPIIEYIKKESLDLSGILNTHHHWDHVRGNSALQSLFNCSVLEKEDHQVVLGQGHLLKFMDTPGHAPDHLAFLWQNKESTQALFSGDTLFNAGVGNCKGAGGSVEALFATTEELKKLPDEIVLHPGHDYILKNLLFAKSCEPENRDIDEALRLVRDASTESGVFWTLGQEKKINPFLRLDSEEIKNVVQADIPKKLFIKLRSMRDNW